MSTPIPLADPQGRVWAYLCGHCHHLGAQPELLVGQDEPTEDLVESSRGDAERCCTCCRCGKLSAGPGERMFHSRPCAACKPADDAELAERQAKWARMEETRKARHAAGWDGAEAQMLLVEMEEISEERHCAGWMGGLEFELWADIIRLEAGEGEYSGEAMNLKVRSEKSGGWWRWQEGDEECAGGPVFILLDEWKAMYAAREASR